MGVCLGVSAITWQFGLAGGSDGNYRRNVFFEQQLNKMIRILLKVMAINFKVFIISIRKKFQSLLAAATSQSIRPHPTAGLRPSVWPGSEA